MKLTKQMRVWYKEAVKEKNTTLSKMFKEISEIIDNNNSTKGKNKKAVKDKTFVFKPGDTASFIDNL
jgi:hypothetical protein